MPSSSTRDAQRLEPPSRQQLLLARLFAAGKTPPALGRLAQDLRPLAGADETTASWRAKIKGLLRELRGQGLLTAARGGYVLTEAGRAAAADFLGLRGRDAAKSPTWKTLRNAYLAIRALGLLPDGETRRRLARPGALEAAVLSRALDLPTRALPTTGETRAALVWRALGVDSTRRLAPNALARVALERQLASAADTSAAGNGTGYPTASGRHDKGASPNGGAAPEDFLLELARAALADSEGRSLAQVRNALVWSALGVTSDRRPEATALTRAVVGSTLGRSVGKARPRQALARLAAYEVGARRPGKVALAEALVQRWVRGRPLKASTTTPT